MQASKLLELIRRRPFTPLRLHVSERADYDIHHPDQIIVLRDSVDIGVGQTDTHDGVAHRVERLSLAHVIRVEPLPADHAPSQ